MGSFAMQTDTHIYKSAIKRVRGESEVKSLLNLVGLEISVDAKPRAIWDL